MVVLRIALTWIAFASLSASGSAHPGHSSHQDGNSFLHYATSPLHVLPVVVAAILFAGMARMVHSRRQISTVAGRTQR